MARHSFLKVTQLNSGVGCVLIALKAMTNVKQRHKIQLLNKY